MCARGNQKLLRGKENKILFLGLLFPLRTFHGECSRLCSFSPLVNYFINNTPTGGARCSRLGSPPTTPLHTPPLQTAGFSSRTGGSGQVDKWVATGRPIPWSAPLRNSGALESLPLWEERIRLPPEASRGRGTPVVAGGPQALSPPVRAGLGSALLSLLRGSPAGVKFPASPTLPPGAAAPGNGQLGLPARPGPAGAQPVPRCPPRPC